MYEDFGLFIDNAWRPARGGKTTEIIDPTTEDALGVPRAEAADLDDALAAAGRAAKGWAATPGWERSRRHCHVGQFYL